MRERRKGCGRGRAGSVAEEGKSRGRRDEIGFGGKQEKQNGKIRRKRTGKGEKGKGTRWRTKGRREGTGENEVKYISL